MIPHKVLQFLEAHGLHALEFEEGSTPTSEMAAQHIGVELGQIAKSLLFKSKSGEFHLLVCSGDSKVSSGDFKRLVGSALSMTSAEETFAATGFRPGGVCPFGIEGVRIWIDSLLRRWETIYPAAGTNASGVPISFETLLKITSGTECAVCRTLEAIAE